MLSKVFTIAALIAVCTAEPPTPQPRYSPAEAFSSQSFTRHDVPLSYTQTSTHPKYVTQEISTAHNVAPAPASYVTPIPALYSTRMSATSELIQYSTASPQYVDGPTEKSTKGQSLYTKVKSSISPSENHPQPEFTQAYFLPKSLPQYQNVELYSSPQQSQNAGLRGQFYVTQQYSEGPALFEPAMQYQAPGPQYQAPAFQHQSRAPQYQAPAPQYQATAQQYQTSGSQYKAIPQQVAPTLHYTVPASQPHIYQIAQQAPVKYVSGAKGSQQFQEYAHQPLQLAYRSAAPTNQEFQSGNILKSIEYQVANYNGYEPAKAPVIAKFSPAAFMTQSFAKSTPVYIQAAPAYAKSSPIYTVSESAQTKPTLNYVQIAPDDTKTQHVEASQSLTNSAYSQAPRQYIEPSPSHGQTTQLYAVPSNSRHYYAQQ